MNRNYFNFLNLLLTFLLNFIFILPSQNIVKAKILTTSDKHIKQYILNKNKQDIQYGNILIKNNTRSKLLISLLITGGKGESWKTEPFENIKIVAPIGNYHVTITGDCYSEDQTLSKSRIKTDNFFLKSGQDHIIIWNCTIW